jgi:hypothetical protein
MAGGKAKWKSAALGAGRGLIGRPSYTLRTQPSFNNMSAALTDLSDLTKDKKPERISVTSHSPLDQWPVHQESKKCPSEDTEGTQKLSQKRTIPAFLFASSPFLAFLVCCHPDESI